MLSCECDYDGDSYWQVAKDCDFEPLATKRGRRCQSCKKLVKVGEDCVKVDRFRAVSSYVEECIYGYDGEVTLAPWYLCESCGGLLMAILERGFCCTLGAESLQEQIREYNDAAGIPTLGGK